MPFAPRIRPHARLVKAGLLLPLLITLACERREAPVRRMEKPQQPALNQMPPLQPEEPQAPAQLPPGHPPMDSKVMPPTSGPSKPVVIPPALQNRWKAVRIVLKAKKSGKEQSFALPLGQDAKLPPSPLHITLQYPLPSFSMEGGVFTSKSEQMENPAVFAILREGNKVLFQGWMFVKFPDTHAFEHPDYAIRVVEFVK